VGFGGQCDSGGGAFTVQPHRVAGLQPERGEHFGVEPDDATPGVECGGAQ
jgi:hypothetical protein